MSYTTSGLEYLSLASSCLNYNVTNKKTDEVLITFSLVVVDSMHVMGSETQPHIQ
jgi:hypothetical protein